MKNKRNTLNKPDLSGNISMLIKPVKNMRKVMYALVLVSGLVFANREIKNEASKKSTPKLLPAVERKDEMKKWEASTKGEKMLIDVAKIGNHIKAFTNMEAIVTSLSLPLGSRLGFGMMVRINGVDYIVKFEPEKSELDQLQSLKVNDKIIIRSYTVSHAPKYSYPIIWGDYIERDSKVIFKRIPPKGGC